MGRNLALDLFKSAWVVHAKRRFGGLSRWSAMEFIRRFSIHILPKCFVRIRHYGILSSHRKQKLLPLIHRQLDSTYQKINQRKDWKQICTQHLGYDPDCCPACKQKAMITVRVFDRRGPPDISFIKIPHQGQARISRSEVDQASLSHVAERN